MSQILGALFAILIGIISLPTYLAYQEQSNENLRAATTAQQQSQFNTAASAYVQQNAIAIQGAATATTPSVITVPMLKAVNLLPAAFNTVNPFGQTWVLQVLQPSAGNLQALAMTTGGTALSDRVATKVATIVGATGGFIPKNDSGIYPGASANAYGAFAGWSLPTANYTSVVGGELASLLTFNNGQLVDNRLYRNLVPGQPQLNQMNTPLIMASVQVANTACSAGSIARDAAGAVLSCQGLLWKTQGSGFWKDPVANFSSLPITGDAVGSVRMTLDTGRGFVWSGATWTPLSFDQNGDLIVPRYLKLSGGAVENGACTTTGTTAMVGTDPDGRLLSCQGGLWSPASRSPKGYRYVFTTSQNWVVPRGIKSAFVTMAGGGGSGLGWRSVSVTMTGASGGYVFSQPVNLVEDETLAITVGTGGPGYTVVNTGATAAPGAPYYIYAPPSGDDGLGGYPGTASKLTSPSAGVLLECDGGSGAYLGGVDAYTGPIVAGYLNGALSGGGLPAYASPNRIASGPYNGGTGGPGACGLNSYGIGNMGSVVYATPPASGNRAGGVTPFGYGSGGGVSASGCYVTANYIGTCISSGPGRDGVVMIDVMY